MTYGYFENGQLKAVSKLPRWLHNGVEVVGVQIADREHFLQAWQGDANGSWQPAGQALLDAIAAEEAARQADETERQQARALVANLRAGTATNLQVQRALARVIIELLT